MSELTVNAYVYRRTPQSAPVLVEKCSCWIAEVGESGWRHIDGYPGTFTKLVELEPQASSLQNKETL